jgi:hypothetical protein
MLNSIEDSKDIGDLESCDLRGGPVKVGYRRRKLNPLDWHFSVMDCCFVGCKREVLARKYARLLQDE